jgi:hypothetical protein
MIVTETPEPLKYPQFRYFTAYIMDLSAHRKKFNTTGDSPCREIGNDMD